MNKYAQLYLEGRRKVAETTVETFQDTSPAARTGSGIAGAALGGVAGAGIGALTGALSTPDIDPETGERKSRWKKTLRNLGIGAAVGAGAGGAAGAMFPPTMTAKTTVTQNGPGEISAPPVPDMGGGEDGGLPWGGIAGAGTAALAALLAKKFLKMPRMTSAPSGGGYGYATRAL